jgi:membrane associated rhomboid family serine protease
VRQAEYLDFCLLMLSCFRSVGLCSCYCRYQYPRAFFAVGYALLELTLGEMGREAGVAHFAHLGGMLGAGLYLLNMRRRL